jgi:hypothetical protein
MPSQQEDSNGSREPTHAGEQDAACETARACCERVGTRQRGPCRVGDVDRDQCCEQERDENLVREVACLAQRPP